MDSLNESNPFLPIEFYNGLFFICVYDVNLFIFECNTKARRTSAMRTFFELFTIVVRLKILVALINNMSGLGKHEFC
jgi:hypothetical protein